MKEIRQTIDAGQECTVRLINYTKSGQPFWNMFSLAPVYGNDGKVRYFVGVQLDVSSKDMSPPTCAPHPTPSVAFTLERHFTRARMRPCIYQDGRGGAAASAIKGGGEGCRCQLDVGKGAPSRSID